ncbi:type II toxin-antitoxin system MqsA family antitoxin [Roseateles aquatilis]
MALDTRDAAHVYKGRTVVIPAVTGDHCPACDECLTEHRETDKIIQAVNELSKQVDAPA